MIERGPSIKYINDDGKNHLYYIDYKIKNTNIIFEIKSSYFLKLHEKICYLKEKECKKQNFIYYMILDNNFNNLIKIFNEK